MTDPLDLIARRNEIKDALASAQYERALKRLIDFLEDFAPAYQPQALDLSEQYYALPQREQAQSLVPALLQLLRQGEGVNS